MAVRPIVLYPDPVLLTPTKAVDQMDARTHELIQDMIDTMHAAPGIGLAANQVGEGVRICVVDLSVGENPDDLTVLVNPQILSTEGLEVAEEGCLSFPDITIDVERPPKASV